MKGLKYRLLSTRSNISEEAIDKILANIKRDILSYLIKNTDIDITIDVRLSVEQY